MEHIKYFNSMDEFKSNAESIPTPCVCVTENDGGQMVSYRASDDKEFQSFQCTQKVDVKPDPWKAIDLGLPSGRLWANMNVGATKPEESGLYFMWGEVEGNDCSDGTTNGRVYNATTYNELGLNSITTDLDLAHDAANHHMGGTWHMPTKEDFQELYDNTDQTWISINGVNGWKFAKKGDASTFIFIPTAGNVDNSSLRNNGARSFVWSSSFLDATLAYRLSARQEYVTPQGSNGRYMGFSVRGVK